MPEVGWHYIAPGKHSRTATTRASTAAPDELLNETLFRSLGHARAVLEARRRDYNEQRPHSKLGCLTPRASAEVPLGNAAGALRYARAPRPLLLPHHQTWDQITAGLSSQLDENGGHVSRDSHGIHLDSRPPPATLPPRKPPSPR